MKLITLNTWGGVVYEPLISFLKEKAVDTDIFCFQEMYDNASEDIKDEPGDRVNLYSEICALLTDFDGYFSSQRKGEGMAVFVRKTIAIEELKSYVILNSEEMERMKSDEIPNPFPRVLQELKLKNGLTVYNFHGMPKFEKKDIPERDLQTKRLLEVVDANSGSKILAGDFNLNRDTNSIRLIGENMRNLIEESDFKTTRSHRYDQIATQPFADYIFVSKDIKVAHFEVLQDDISDHLPLLLEFSI